MSLPPFHLKSCRDASFVPSSPFHSIRGIIKNQMRMRRDVCGYVVGDPQLISTLLPSSDDEAAEAVQCPLPSKNDPS